MAKIKYKSSAKTVSLPFNVSLELLIPEKAKIKGSVKNVIPENGDKIFCNFRTFGGTEKIIDGVLAIENTAVIYTWYRPDITSSCIFRTESGEKYEIIGTPENLDMRNQFLRIKVRSINGE